MTQPPSYSISPKTLFLLFALTYCFFYHAGQDNENARLAQARVIAEYGALNIDRYINSADVIKFEGATYPNKAPGISLLAAPLWKVIHPFSQSLFSSPETAEHITCHCITLCLAGFPTALIGALLLLFIRARTENEPLALLLSLSYALGSIAFPFATLLFSHQLAACMLFAAFYLLSKETPSMLPAGILLGYSITTEYPAALAVAPLFLYGLGQATPSKAKGVFLLGILLGITPLFAYQTLAFGDPFFIPYSAYTQEGERFPSHALGLWGVSLPQPKVLYNILFSFRRGLFIVNPWLICSIFAALAALYVLKKKGGAHKRELSIAVTISLLFTLFNAGFGDSIVYWGGGASVGPRHILPMLPFTTMLIGLLPWRRWGTYLLTLLAPLSITSMFLATVTEPRVPYDYHHPLFDLFWKNYVHARIMLGERGTFSDKLMTDTSVSYNLSQLIGLPPQASLFPLLLIWAWALLVLFPLKDKAYQVFRFLLLSFFVVLMVAPAAVRTTNVLGDTQSQGLLMTVVDGVAWETPNEPLRDPAMRGEKVFARKITSNVLLTPGMVRQIAQAPFSLEWQGYLRIDTPGEYYIGTESDDGSAVIIDGELLVQNWGNHPTKRVMQKKHFKQGIYPLTVRYFNAQGEGTIRLLWSPPYAHTHTIPSDVLRMTKPTFRRKG